MTGNTYEIKAEWKRIEIEDLPRIDYGEFEKRLNKHLQDYRWKKTQETREAKLKRLWNNM